VSNASTIRRQIAGTQQLTIAPLLGTTITTTPTAFQLNNNGLTLTGGGVIPLSTGVTGLYQGTGQVLVIRAAGSYSGATLGSAPITNVAITSNVLTITATNTFVPGQIVTFTGLTTATFLNGQTVTIATASGSQFTANFTHANYVSAADTGTASLISLALTLYEVPASLLPIANTLVGAQTFTNWNVVATQAAAPVLTAVGSFQFEAYLQLDAVGDLQGTYTSNIDGVIKTSTIATTVTGLVGEADLNFVLVATLGGTTTGVILTLNEFGLDLQ